MVVLWLRVDVRLVVTTVEAQTLKLDIRMKLTTVPFTPLPPLSLSGYPDSHCLCQIQLNAGAGHTHQKCPVLPQEPAAFPLYIRQDSPAHPGDSLPDLEHPGRQRQLLPRRRSQGREVTMVTMVTEYSYSSPPLIGTPLVAKKICPY